MTRMLIASLCLALAACAGDIAEPGQGGDDNADNTGDNTDNTDNTDDGTPAPSFTSTVLPIVQGNCVGCHEGLAMKFSGSAQEVYDRVMSLPNIVNVDDPAASLLYLKPTGSVSHGGQKLFETNSAQATAILDWIGGGAEI